MKGKISEVFFSLQGEGLYLGEKQVFVRFFGCNLKCNFCDTPLNASEEVHYEDLLSKIKLYGTNFHSVSFTGGEPLLQKDFLKKITELTHQAGFKNYLETNGTLPGELQEVIDHIDIIAMDLKLPSSTGLGDFWEEHLKFLRIASRKEVFLKIVVSKTTEEGDILETIRIIKETNPDTMLILQPNSFDHKDALQEKLEDFQDIFRKNGIKACVVSQKHKEWGIP